MGDMEDNPYKSASASPDSPRRRAMLTRTPVAVIIVIGLAYLMAVLASPAGDPESMVILWPAGTILGLICFMLGRASRKQPEPATNAD